MEIGSWPSAPQSVPTSSSAPSQAVAPESSAQPPRQEEPVERAQLSPTEPAPSQGGEAMAEGLAGSLGAHERMRQAISNRDFGAQTRIAQEVQASGAPGEDGERALGAFATGGRGHQSVQLRESETRHRRGRTEQVSQNRDRRWSSDPEVGSTRAQSETRRREWSVASPVGPRISVFRESSRENGQRTRQWGGSLEWGIGFPRLGLGASLGVEVAGGNASLFARADRPTGVNTSRGVELSTSVDRTAHERDAAARALHAQQSRRLDRQWEELMRPR